MDFKPSPERQILFDTLKKYFENEYSLSDRNIAAHSDLGYSKKAWEYWCNKNDCIFVDFTEPVEKNLNEFRPNWQKAIFVFDELEKRNIAVSYTHLGAHETS